MILGSHNSWSYLPTKKWWMKLLSFTAKCQDLSIVDQYNAGVRCFDLRVRWDNKGNFIVAHGIIEYDIQLSNVISLLKWLNSLEDCYVRILHEVRNLKQYTPLSRQKFQGFCMDIEMRFPNIKFWCGKNLYNWEVDYEFSNDPSCEEKYASVCAPKLIDDWYPRLFAKKNNKRVLKDGTDKDILLIDFVNYGY